MKVAVPAALLTQRDQVALLQLQIRMQMERANVVYLEFFIAPTRLTLRLALQMFFADTWPL